MTTSPTEGSARERGQFHRWLPVAAGSVIAAAGLAFGSLSVAGATTGHQPPSIEQQAAKVKAEDAYTPVNGNTEMNVNVLEDQIEHYYGSASATFPVVGTVTIPSATSNYAKQMKQIVANAEQAATSRPILPMRRNAASVPEPSRRNTHAAMNSPPKTPRQNSIVQTSTSISRVK